MIPLLVAALTAFQCPDGTPPPCSGVRPVTPVLVVTPFESRARDTADAYLAAALTEDVTTALAASHLVRLVSPRASRRGAQYVLAGSVRPGAGVVRLTARLERAGTGEILWTTSFDAPSAQSVGTADTLTTRVLARLGVRGRVTVRESRPVNPVARDLYLRGRYYALRRNAADIARGMALLRQAVAADSTYGLAWAAIARALDFAINFRIPVPGMSQDSLVIYELEASNRALVSDSTSPEIWIARSFALRNLDRTTRTAPLHALRRALALDSLNAPTWSAMVMVLEEAGDSAAAIHAARRAIALDPGGLDGLTNGALHFYWTRQLDSAAVWADSLVDNDPAYISGRRLAGTVALARGRLAEAEAQFSAARTIGPGPERVWALAGLACVAVARGDTARARALVAEAESLTERDNPALHSAVFLAWGYAALGQHAAALDWLERYQPAGDRHFQLHLLDAPLEPLRGEPRFRALLATR